MDNVSLEQIIRTYINLGRPNPSGWEATVHKTCDHGKKGPRAAFKFDGDKVAFHCYNCPASTVYDPSEYPHIPEKMVKVLRDFGIPDSEWKQIEFNLMKNTGSKPSQNRSEALNIEPPELALPSHFYPLNEADSSDKWAIIARDYLEETRGIQPDSYPFYLSTGKDGPNRIWTKRVIIPIYKDRRLIYYQGRSLIDQELKYKSPSQNKDCVLYGFDQVYARTDTPLYVMEGFFDAYMINGVGTLGNELTKQQIAHLLRSRRDKVIIPDRFGDGDIMARQALKLGWSISTPDIGNCKDINQAVKRYGKLYVMQSIIENTRTGFDAEMALELYCGKEDVG